MDEREWINNSVVIGETEGLVEYELTDMDAGYTIFLTFDEIEKLYRFAVNCENEKAIDEIVGYA